MDNIPTLNVEPYSTDGVAFSKRYSDFISQIRVICGVVAYTDVTNGVTTLRENDPIIDGQPDYNAILYTEWPQKAVTLKSAKLGLYIQACRSGRGEPNAEDNSPWRTCVNYKGVPIPGSVEGSFGEAYSVTFFDNREEIGPHDLKSAVLGLYDQRDEKRSFVSMIVFVAEAARFHHVFNKILGVILKEENGEFDTETKTLCKSWSKVGDSLRPELKRMKDAGEVVLDDEEDDGVVKKGDPPFLIPPSLNTWNNHRSIKAVAILNPPRN